MRTRRPPIEIRKQQIEKELDRVRGTTRDQDAEALKDRSHVSEVAIKTTRENYGLNRELSILRERGEYNELPIAVVADELDLRPSEMREEQFEALIRNASYAPLHAEASYNESAAARILVDTITSDIPRSRSPAELIEKVPRKQKAHENRD